MLRADPAAGDHRGRTTGGVPVARCGCRDGKPTAPRPHASLIVATTQNTTGVARPTVADWLEPDHRGWSFQHVREIVPSARICAARVPRPLPEDLLALDRVPVLA